MKLIETRVAIIGLGLMGGSLARALQGNVASLIGVDINPISLDYARGLDIFDHLSPDSAEGLRRCDLAILALPVRGILDLIARINRDLPAPPYLMDLGSTKKAITRSMQALPGEVNPIGGHPLCGKETAGIQASEADIFQGSTFVLTPLARTSPACLSLAEELAASIGARPLVMDAEEHDRMLAITSHLPYLVSVTLTKTAIEAEGPDRLLRELIASGFIDTTRIAASDVRMISDVLLTNRVHLLQALRHFSGNAETLANLIENGSPDALCEGLMPIQRWRQGIQKHAFEEA
ncbi:MAG: prephenate dehydrogenase [Anaerolineales bacterium]|nr:prephenate dehydrogenase [Anaerolineales bacterium]